ncbi:MAG: mechanosensitive ion channel [Deltaproteobacteria bacterium]|nr:mechanosensitive ion channel [Deltaproteobacteria bacterium]NIS76950.1 mechanosensitive ion channel [Deltaproteobacteria bacterium]
MAEAKAISILEFIAGQIGIDSNILSRIIVSLVIILTYLFLRRVLNALIINRSDDSQTRYLATKLTNYFLGFLVLVIIGSIWLRGTGLLAYVGILSAGLAIALQDLVVNFAAWLFILFRRPFSLGNRIEIGQHMGDVIDIRMFMFSLMEVGVWTGGDQSTGRVIHIPNGWIFKQSITNYNEAFNYIWNELALTITFESNWEKAKEILTYIVNEQSEETMHNFHQELKNASRKYMIFFRHIYPSVWTQVADYGVTFYLRYICEPTKRRETDSHLWEMVLSAFSEHNDIDFAYPTTRFYDNRTEGKEGVEKATPPKI